MLENLINNAVKYSPKVSVITVDCEILGMNVKVSIKEQGIGIGQLEHDRLFERFYRVNNEGIKNFYGFGIGLFLVAEILQHHHTKIQLKSGEKEGSTFYFELPLESLTNQIACYY